VHPLFILLALLAVVFTIRWVKAQPPEKRQGAGFTAALVGAGALLLVAAATGRLNPLVAAVAAAIPMLQRLGRAKSVFDNLRTRAQNSTTGSVFSTSRLHITVDPNSGEWRGTVLQAPFKGQALDTLSFDQLRELMTGYEREDPESAALLAAYLERHHQQRWQSAGARSAGPARNTTMSEIEARQILGLSESASREEVIAAHRRLMQKLHPDRGGSDYLASQINQAKDRLLETS
jgi:hypothetical protein